MPSKTTYWISNAEGVHAQVEGAEQRDLATRLYGWAEVDEPGPLDQVHAVNEHPEIGPGRLSYGALASDAWAGRGWRPGPPPELATPVDEPAKTTKPAAGGAQSKEK
jgi:hypothetical protein